MAEKPFTYKQRVLWSRLSDYIRANDGFLTSRTETHTLRFECRTDSTLPALLRSAGHDVRNAGTAERLLPTIEAVNQHDGVTKMVTQGVAPVEVVVFEFELP